MVLSRQRVLRLALAVLAGILLAVAIDVARVGGPRLWLARHGLPPPYLPQGERIAVGTGSFYLDCRGEGSPTVVLESGAGSGAGAWSPVFDDIAMATRTCAYDRAGFGSSDPRGTRTLRQSAHDLRELLRLAGEQPPFVAVGHSLGGSYARVFASEHRAETPAFVLIDSFDPDLQTDVIHPLLGTLEPEYEDRLDDLRRTVEAWERLDWDASEAQLREADVTGLRLAVLVAHRYEPRLDAATNEQIRRAWIEAFEALSPGRVTYEYAPGAGHLIPIDRPDLVAELVRRVANEVRTGR
ncbi:MAG TPA: alpha/beta hydrolase [Vitreimonas sp.]|nr:alpha/beta hydrolase [Vitreimonas sp.]